MAIDITKFITRFVDEAREHLTQLNDGLAALASGHSSRQDIDQLFRSAHTIKGSSRMLKLTTITETAHALEDVLGALRSETLSYDPALGKLVQRGVDALSQLVDLLAQTADPAQLPAADADLCAALTAAASGAPPATEQSPPPAVVAAAPAPAPAPVAESTADPDAPRFASAETVRVRIEQLDLLIKLMGEVIASHDQLHQRLVEIRILESSLGQHGALTAWIKRLRHDVQTQETLIHQLHERALTLRMLPLSLIFEPAARMARELARSVGKELHCQISGATIELDRQLIESLSDPIVHLLRNAVDHAFEPPDQRQAANKPTAGQLMLSAHQDGGWVSLAIRDDGRGIDLAAVRDKAVRRGLLTAEQAATASEREIIDLIFEPGFSTSALITDLSGRGVGMDVVKSTVIDTLQGTIQVETHSGAGTTFTLRLPVSLAVLRVLLIESGGQLLGFMAPHVAELLRVSPTALMAIGERSAVIVRNEFVPVIALAELLGLEAAAPNQHGLLLVVLRVRHEKIALVVDALYDERDMIVKPLPDHLRHLTLISGLVSTGAQALISVLHAPAVLALAARLRQVSASVPAAASGSQSWRLLVVDDSLNTREIEKDVLQAHGYQVTLAEDGIDGLNKALAESYDAVLTDVEMPRMDGFTLTERLRQQDSYRSTPIIIVTSREKEEDKRRGVQVGADAYIVKGDFDQNNLVATLRALLG